jgi:hypothetical protein
LLGFWIWSLSRILKNTKLTGGPDDDGMLPDNQPLFYMTQPVVEEPVDVAALYTEQESVCKLHKKL